MNRTPIEWTDFSANPLKFRAPDGRVVWACEKLSPGCANCYAEDLSHRYGGVRRAGDWNANTMATLTPFLDEFELREMLTARERRGKQVAGGKVFVGDMTDIFGSWMPDALLDKLFAVFALRPDVTWQILTKRAARMLNYFSLIGRKGSIAIDAHRIADARNISRPWWGDYDADPWPLPNVWLGVSVENQRFADERIPLLLQTPAAIRFISAEPLLGPDIYAECAGTAIDLRDRKGGTPEEWPEDLRVRNFPTVR
jgi:protein gp37